MTRRDTRGLPRPDLLAELNTPSCQVLENTQSDLNPENSRVTLNSAPNFLDGALASIHRPFGLVVVCN